VPLPRDGPHSLERESSRVGLRAHPLDRLSAEIPSPHPRKAEALGASYKWLFSQNNKEQLTRGARFDSAWIDNTYGADVTRTAPVAIQMFLGTTRMRNNGLLHDEGRALAISPTN
jgi:hypothetical protein